MPLKRVRREPPFPVALLCPLVRRTHVGSAWTRELKANTAQSAVLSVSGARGLATAGKSLRAYTALWRDVSFRLGWEPGCPRDR